jgi:hypothetical protein
MHINICPMWFLVIHAKNKPEKLFDKCRKSENMQFTLATNLKDCNSVILEFK